MQSPQKTEKSVNPSSAPAQPDQAKSTARITPPIPNYTLSTVCPACNTPTYRHACKVRCPKCGFMWDCSEL